MGQNHFGPRQIETLINEFEKIGTVNPDRLPEFRSILGSMPFDVLVQVSNAGIKFLSRLAVNEITRRAD